MSVSEEVLGVGRVIADLGKVLVQAAEDSLRDLKTQLSAQYTIARTNLAVAEAQVQAAARQEPEEAKKTLEAVRLIIDDTEKNLMGRVLALGFNVRQDVRELFAKARAAAEFVARLPVDVAKGAAHQFAFTTLAGVVGLVGLGWWFTRGPGRR